MSIEDDVALLERVPTLRLLGATALRMLAAGLILSGIVLMKVAT